MGKTVNQMQVSTQKCPTCGAEVMSNYKNNPNLGKCMNGHMVGLKQHNLSMWVIYDHPKDHPDAFVVRRWYIEEEVTMPDKTCLLADSLQEARELIPAGRYRIGRQANDDPVIVESWI